VAVQDQISKAIFKAIMFNLISLVAYTALAELNFTLINSFEKNARSDAKTKKKFHTGLRNVKRETSVKLRSAGPFFFH
jgi:hypothetical protein